jgi:hypothetical protein
MEASDPITEALDFLESQGFYIHNLWHIQDVQDKFECTPEEAMKVLDEAVSGELIMEDIQISILIYGRQNGLKEKINGCDSNIN